MAAPKTLNQAGVNLIEKPNTKSATEVVKSQHCEQEPSSVANENSFELVGRTCLVSSNSTLGINETIRPKDIDVDSAIESLLLKRTVDFSTVLDENPVGPAMSILCRPRAESNEKHLVRPIEHDCSSVVSIMFPFLRGVASSCFTPDYNHDCDLAHENISPEENSLPLSSDVGKQYNRSAWFQHDPKKERMAKKQEEGLYSLKKITNPMTLSKFNSMQSDTDGCMLRNSDIGINIDERRKVGSKGISQLSIEIKSSSFCGDVSKPCVSSKKLGKSCSGGLDTAPISRSIRTGKEADVRVGDVLQHVTSKASSLSRENSSHFLSSPERLVRSNSSQGGTEMSIPESKFVDHGVDDKEKNFAMPVSSENVVKSTSSEEVTHPNVGKKSYFLNADGSIRSLSSESLIDSTSAQVDKYISMSEKHMTENEVDVTKREFTSSYITSKCSKRLDKSASNQPDVDTSMPENSIGKREVGDADLVKSSPNYHADSSIGKRNVSENDKDITSKVSFCGSNSIQSISSDRLVKSSLIQQDKESSTIKKRTIDGETDVVRHNFAFPCGKSSLHNKSSRAFASSELLAKSGLSHLDVDMAMLKNNITETKAQHGSKEIMSMSKKSSLSGDNSTPYISSRRLVKSSSNQVDSHALISGCKVGEEQTHVEEYKGSMSKASSLSNDSKICICSENSIKSGSIQLDPRRNAKPLRYSSDLITDETEFRNKNSTSSFIVSKASSLSRADDSIPSISSGRLVTSNSTQLYTDTATSASRINDAVQIVAGKQFKLPNVTSKASSLSDANLLPCLYSGRLVKTSSTQSTQLDVDTSMSESKIILEDSIDSERNIGDKDFTLVYVKSKSSSLSDDDFPLGVKSESTVKSNAKKLNSGNSYTIRNALYVEDEDLVTPFVNKRALLLSGDDLYEGENVKDSRVTPYVKSNTSFRSHDGSLPFDEQKAGQATHADPLAVLFGEPTNKLPKTRSSNDPRFHDTVIKNWEMVLLASSNSADSNDARRKVETDSPSQETIEEIKNGFIKDGKCFESRGEAFLRHNVVGIKGKLGKQNETKERQETNKKTQLRYFARRRLQLRDSSDSYTSSSTSHPVEDVETVVISNIESRNTAFKLDKNKNN